LLADLDELIVTCADPRSRKYIQEAVQCYKAGAYRSSVVACWIAVVFDLVDKIREIAATGDGAAQNEIAKFEKIHKANDIAGALAFEKDLLGLAKNKFEFISHSEHQDLVRLVEDRNRCAHPSHVSDNQVFEASAELARLHISNSVRSLLSQPAAQGKAALDRLLEGIDSRFFPEKAEDVLLFLKAGPLKRPRESLLRNYIQIQLKCLLSADSETHRKTRCKAGLFALRQMHPEMWEQIVPPALQAILPIRVCDADLSTVAKFLGTDPGEKLWGYVPEVEKLRLKIYIENCPQSMFSDLDMFFWGKTPSPLRDAATSRIEKASAQEIREVFWFETPGPAIDRIIKAYKHASNFAEANVLGKQLRSYASDSYTKQKHITAIIKAASENEQIVGSNEFPILLRTFAAQKGVGKDFIEKTILENHLSIEWA
jgi:hypothetical protein